MKEIFPGLSGDFYLPNCFQIISLLTGNQNPNIKFDWSRVKDWPYVEYNILDNNTNWYMSESGLIVNKNPITSSERIRMQCILKTLSHKISSFNFDITFNVAK